MEGELDRNGDIVRHDKNPVNKIAEIYIYCCSYIVKFSFFTLLCLVI